MSEAPPRKVAVVDDDAAVRDSLRFFLEVMGYGVATFESAAEFLNAAIDDVACLILDHHMPVMTGLELAEKLHADGSAIPILLITGSPSPVMAARASGLGIKVLDKPPGEDDLLDFVGPTRG
jgi:two-component system, LuxR family, response regulator FixJ